MLTASPRNTERAVKISARLYQCRDAARFLYRDDYKKRMTEIGEQLETLARSNRTSVLQAAIEVSQKRRLDGVALMTVMAAAVELIEPSG